MYALLLYVLLVTIGFIEIQFWKIVPLAESGFSSMDGEPEYSITV
jgi:hypothetical protein